MLNKECFLESLNNSLFVSENTTTKSISKNSADEEIEKWHWEWHNGTYYDGMREAHC